MAPAPVLHVTTTGEGPRLILLHGFTQTGACLADLAAELADDFTVIVPDLPGHGHSAAVHASVADAAALLADACGPGVWFGYSMGGRHALHVAVEHPEVVHGLVVLGATAGIADPRERAARRERDEALAARIEEIGVDAFLEEWLSQPLFARLLADPDDLAKRRTNTAVGLATSLRLAGTGTQEPLDRQLRSFDAPTLVLAGGLDAKFRTEAVRLAAAIGANAGVGVVPDAGHAAHAEQPGAFLHLLRTWLAGRLP